MESGGGTVFSLLLAYRLFNAFCIRTFFQPDEYFQALEPAWSIAFGTNSGAWLTWVGIHSQDLLRTCKAPIWLTMRLTGDLGMATPAALVSASAALRRSLPGSV
jgi:phosphatidylinositol glycan class B